jgi:hypothetical protein
MVDVSTLKQQIQGTVLLPGDEGFEESLKRWAINAERRAGIVVYVTSADDVSATVTVRRMRGLTHRSNSLPPTKFPLQLGVEDIPLEAPPQVTAA